MSFIDADSGERRAFADGLAATRGEIAELSAAARAFGAAMSSALKGAVIEGRAFDSVLKTVGLRLLKVGADAAGRLIAGGLAALTQSALGTAAVELTPFAKGGVVGAPALFPLAGGLGVAGESGAEAILPLARGADGRLGIRSETEIAAPVSVIVNVTTPDAASFRRSEAHVSSVLARAVERGRRTL